MKKLTLSLLAAGLVVTAACSPAQDGISDVIGQNPISDGRDVVHRATNSGWTSSQANRLVDELVDEVDLARSEAECVRDHVMDTWTPSEWLATTGDEPEIASMLTDCLT